MPPPPQYIYRHRQHIGHGDYAKHRAIAHPVNQQAGQTAAEADSDIIGTQKGRIGSASPIGCRSVYRHRLKRRFNAAKGIAGQRRRY